MGVSKGKKYYHCSSIYHRVMESDKAGHHYMVNELVREE